MNLWKLFQRKRAEADAAPKAPEEAREPKPAVEPPVSEPAAPAEKSLQAKQRELAKKGADALAELIERNIPPAGRARPVYVQLPILGTRNSALLVVEPNADNRAVTLGAMREGYDMQVMNFVFSGTNDEIKAWLARPETLDELVSLMTPLSEKLDDKLD